MLCLVCSTMLVCIPDLVADGTVVIGIHYGDFHRSPGDVQAIAGCNVEQIPILLLTVQQAAHVDLPLSLHQCQAKHAPRISPWRAHTDILKVTTPGTAKRAVNTLACKQSESPVHSQDINSHELPRSSIRANTDDAGPLQRESIKIHHHSYPGWWRSSSCLSKFGIWPFINRLPLGQSSFGLMEA